MLLNASCLKTLMFSFLLMHVFSFGFAQEVSLFDSLYTSETGIKGRATYTFQPIKNEIIKSGDFSFTAEIPDASCPTRLINHNWKGAYKENQKDGEWKYTIRDYEVEISTITTKEMTYDILLQESIYTINYKEGRLDDRFFYERNLLRNGKKVKTIEKLTLTFSEHKINGELRYERNDNHPLIVTGRAFAGLMEGEWLFSEELSGVTEKRTYKKGVLIELARFQDKDTLLALKFPLSPGIESALNSEESDIELVGKPLSLIFSDGYPRNCHFITSQKEANTALEDIIQLIFEFDPSLKLSFGHVIGTNRGFYPLTGDEKQILKDWPQTEFNYRKAIQHTKDMYLANIRYEEDSLMQFISAWIDAQEQLCDYIQPWNQILFKDQLEFYNRNGLLVDYARSILSQDSLDIQMNEIQTISYEIESSSKDFLAYLANNIQARTAYSDSLIAMADKRLGKLYLVDEVSDLNKLIILEQEKTAAIFTQHQVKSSIYPYLKNISEFYLGKYYTEHYENFISENSVINQKELGTELLNDLNILQEIEQEFRLIEERARTLDSLYTEYTFDPFTYSDKVPVRVKKKLYDTVTDDMFFKLLNDIDPKHSTPVEVLHQLYLVSALQKRLFFLRDKDTKQIERKLRGKKSVKERLEILKVES